MERGYRVVVPDMLGYGKTDMPPETWAYSTKHLCSDLAALLDYIGVQKAVSVAVHVAGRHSIERYQIIIGHDWGAFIVSRFALWQPDRSLAIAMYVDLRY